METETPYKVYQPYSECYQVHQGGTIKVYTKRLKDKVEVM